MNKDNADHPSVVYYDSDYPAEDGPVAENFDATTERQGLRWDVQRYRELAAAHDGAVLELCCGSGRVGRQLAKAGHDVVGVDIARAMLDRFAASLEPTPEAAARVTLIEQDITRLQLDHTEYALALIPFNSLMLITDLEQQCAALAAARRHLRKGGTLVVDAMNPLFLPLKGDPTPIPFFTRTRVDNGRRYTRFAAMSPLRTDQTQTLYGWYDEIAGDGVVHRAPYEIVWRPLFRSELELMLRAAGYRLRSIEGGHQHEPWSVDSRKLFVIAEAV